MRRISLIGLNLTEDEIYKLSGTIELMEDVKTNFIKDDSYRKEIVKSLNQAMDTIKFLLNGEKIID